MTKTAEKNPLECEVCSYVAGAPATARIHANTHTVEVEEIKKVVKKKK